jgi:signal transduction histidine kinase
MQLRQFLYDHSTKIPCKPIVYRVFFVSNGSHRFIDRILVLDLTKLRAGRLGVEAAALALLLRRIVSQFTRLAVARGLALHEAKPLSEELTLLLEADKVSQILTTYSAMP